MDKTVYILEDRKIRVEWTILKGTSPVREDFRRALVKVFLIGNCEKYLLEATAERGTLMIDIPEGLEPGLYSLEAIWVKNAGHPGRHDRDLCRSMKQDLFAITEFEEEATNLPEGTVVLKAKSSTATYGYDGLSSYELAVLRGEWNGTEGEWLKHQRYVSVLDGRGDSEVDTMSQKSITEELVKHDTAIEGANKEIDTAQTDIKNLNDEMDAVQDRLAYIPKESFLSSEPACDYHTEDNQDELTVSRAIKDRFGRIIDEHYVTRETVKDYTQEVVDGSKLEIQPGSVQPEDLSPAVQQMIESAAAQPGHITNLPDEEDLTVTEHNTLQFKDREYNPYNYSGMGKVYLRKHIVNGTNMLTQHMMRKPNTIYVIRYDYCLGGETIEVPEGCVLEFDGGSLRNGVLKGNETLLKSYTKHPFPSNIELKGKWLFEGGNMLIRYFSGRSNAERFQKAIDFAVSNNLEGNDEIPIITVDEDIDATGFTFVFHKGETPRKSVKIIGINRASIYKFDDGAIFEAGKDNFGDLHISNLRFCGNRTTRTAVFGCTSTRFIRIFSSYNSYKELYQVFSNRLKESDNGGDFQSIRSFSDFFYHCDYCFYINYGWDLVIDSCLAEVCSNFFYQYPDHGIIGYSINISNSCIEGISNYAIRITGCNLVNINNNYLERNGHYIYLPDPVTSVEHSYNITNNDLRIYAYRDSSGEDIPGIYAGVELLLTQQSNVSIRGNNVRGNITGGQNDKVKLYFIYFLNGTDRFVDNAIIEFNSEGKKNSIIWSNMPELCINPTSFFRWSNIGSRAYVKRYNQYYLDANKSIKISVPHIFGWINVWAIQSNTPAIGSIRKCIMTQTKASKNAVTECLYDLHNYIYITDAIWNTDTELFDIYIINKNTRSLFLAFELCNAVSYRESFYANIEYDEDFVIEDLDLKDNKYESDIFTRNSSSEDFIPKLVANSATGFQVINTSRSIVRPEFFDLSNRQWVDSTGRKSDLLYGNTSNRPQSLDNGKDVGYMYFDTTISKPIFWEGHKWVDATGSQV